MDIEYAQWALTQKIVNEVITRWSNERPSSIYEMHNIIERMLMSMCNSELCSRRVKPWTIYYTIRPGDPFMRDVKSDLFDKCNLGRSADLVINYICGEINKMVSSPPPVYSYPKTAPIRIFRRRLTYRDFTIALPAKTISRLKRFPPRPMMVMVIRYCALIIKSQQWTIPTQLADTLYNDYNVRFEAFASPLSTVFNEKKNTGFYSLFPEDQQFGSMGNLFDTDMSCPIADVALKQVGWIVHPPYINDIMHKAYSHIMTSMANAELHCIDLFIVFVIPYIPTSKLYLQIRKSHYAFVEIVLTRHTHFYENNGTFINSPFDTVMFMFDQTRTRNISNYSSIVDAIYINNIPRVDNIPKQLRAILRLDDSSRLTVYDKDDDTNVVTLSIPNHKKHPLRLKYRSVSDNYVVNMTETSALVVKL